MESHKRILGILYIATGSLQIFFYLIAFLFLSSILPFLAEEISRHDRWVMEMVIRVIPVLLWGFILLFALPSIIGGILLLQGKQWALTLLLVIGCFKLLSFPIGTALGIYTIWVYAENSKQASNVQA